MGLGNADDVILCGRYQDDPITCRGHHIWCPWRAVTSLADRLDIAQVIQGRLAYLHA